MLKELNVAQKEEDIFRRWFKDDYFDLIVWYNRNDYSIRGFQLCYDIARNERSLTWTAGRGFAHTGVDEGARPMRHPSSPTLVEDGIFPGQSVVERFIRSCTGIDRVISRLVISKINEFGNLNLNLEEVYAALDAAAGTDTSSPQHLPGHYDPPGSPGRAGGPAPTTFSGFVKELVTKKLKSAMAPGQPGDGRKKAASTINEEYRIETSNEDLDGLVKKSQQLAKKISRKKKR
ncbi:MAG TPA: hypothetical protein PK307_14570 [Spirochaetota bacterium]|nr:hypothetical protein [Spirochaetota bacterium]HOD16119.1 hypothetical protein [Spirochaetota bacterium]HPG52226.1 hypothetical protein [Spirochaetota bacterium]HPN14261.1 hypothetical protein [Spirochaetota bacterium]HQL83423.1 hypothetical protein [Spirochaetota bacterium]